MRVQLLDRGEHFKAIAVRQGEIEQDRIEVTGTELDKRAGARVGGMDRIAVVGEQVLQAHGNVRIVFHDEHGIGRGFVGHNSLSQ